MFFYLNFEKVRLLANNYAPVVDQHLQDKYHVKILGLWSFGPQELFCSRAIHQLSDIKEMKVRVQNEPMAQFFKSLGAIPAIISFDDTHAALQNHLVDCGTLLRIIIGIISFEIKKGQPCLNSDLIASAAIKISHQKHEMLASAHSNALFV